MKSKKPGLAEGAMILSITRGRRAIQSLHKGEPLVAVTSPQKCILCEKCIQVCPARVRRKTREEKRVQARIRTCAGCGRCVKVCPKDAVEILPYSDAIERLVTYRFRNKLAGRLEKGDTIEKLLNESFAEVMG